jgi:hypothetical protein
MMLQPTPTCQRMTNAEYYEDSAPEEEPGQSLCDSDACQAADLAIHCDLDPSEARDGSLDEDSIDCPCVPTS